jgi:hypothetical protein
MDMYYGIPENERLPPPASTDVAPSITVHEPHKHESVTEDGFREQFQHTEAPQITIQESTPEPTSEPTPEPTPEVPQEHHQHQQHHRHHGHHGHHEHRHQPHHEKPEFQAPEMEWDATRYVCSFSLIYLSQKVEVLLHRNPDPKPNTFPRINTHS